MGDGLPTPVSAQRAWAFGSGRIQRKVAASPKGRPRRRDAPYQDSTRAHGVARCPASAASGRFERIGRIVSAYSNTGAVNGAKKADCQVEV